MARAPAIAEAEPAPEAERLLTYPHPRHTETVVGHESAELRVHEAFAPGRMHHAWLLVGPTGIGKATLAYRIARWVLAEPGERAAGGTTPTALLDVTPGCTTARQVAALSHPGLMVIRRGYDHRTKRFSASISVDEVRRLKEFLARTNEPGRWRVVIVDSADELNANAANALLKSLEEPPARTLFLLVVSEPGRLLATIRSRTRSLHLAGLSREALDSAGRAALRAAEAGPPAPEDWQRLLVLAEGSVRRLLLLFGTGGLDIDARVCRLLSSLPKIDWQAAHALADDMAAPTAEVQREMLFDRLAARVAEIVRVAALGDSGAAEGVARDDGLSTASVTRLTAAKGVVAWADAWLEIAADQRQTEGLNLDMRALVLRTHERLAAAAGAAEIRASHRRT